MNFFLIYFLTYLFSQIGFILRNSTLEEHIEIKKYIDNYYQKVLIISFYFILFYLTYNSNIIFLEILIFCLFIYSLKNKNYIIKDLHDILIYPIAFFAIYFQRQEFIFLILPLIFYFIIENSFKKFNLKEEFYKVIFIILFYLIFLITKNI